MDLRNLIICIKKLAPREVDVCAHMATVCYLRTSLFNGTSCTFFLKGHSLCSRYGRAYHTRSYNNVGSCILVLHVHGIEISVNVTKIMQKY